MQYGTYRLPNRQRLQLLETLAFCARLPMVACVGPKDGTEVAALAQGLRRACRRGKNQVDNPQGRLIVFHWYKQDRNRIWTTLGKIDGRHRRFPIREIARFSHVGEDGTRRKWEASVNWLVDEMLNENIPRFGLIVHGGQGAAADIRGDLDVLCPMIADDCLLAVCQAENEGAMRYVGQMARKDGWDAVMVGNVALLGRRPFAQAAPEVCDGDTN